MNTSPFQRGYDAYWFIENPHNPFESETTEHTEWEKGWLDAEKFDKLYER